MSFTALPSRVNWSPEPRSCPISIVRAAWIEGLVWYRCWIAAIWLVLIRHSPTLPCSNADIGVDFAPRRAFARERFPARWTSMFSCCCSSLQVTRICYDQQTTLTHTRIRTENGERIADAYSGHSHVFKLLVQTHPSPRFQCGAQTGRSIRSPLVVVFGVPRLITMTSTFILSCA